MESGSEVNPFIFTPYNEKHPRPLLAVVDGSSVQFFRLPGDKRKAYGLTARLSLSVALDFGSFAPLRAVNTQRSDDTTVLEPKPASGECDEICSLSGHRNGVVQFRAGRVRNIGSAASRH